MSVKRDQTRYKRVWDAGYDEATRRANDALVAAVRMGVNFAAPEWAADTIHLKRFGHKTLHGVSAEGLVELLPYLVSKMAAEP